MSTEARLRELLSSEFTHLGKWAEWAPLAYNLIPVESRQALRHLYGFHDDSGLEYAHCVLCALLRRGGGEPETAEPAKAKGCACGVQTEHGPHEDELPASSLQLAQVVAALSGTYKPEGVLIWLTHNRDELADLDALAEKVERLDGIDPAVFDVIERVGPETAEPASEATLHRRGDAHSSSDEEMVIPVVPPGPAPGASDEPARCSHGKTEAHVVRFDEFGIASERCPGPAASGTPEASLPPTMLQPVELDLDPESGIPKTTR
jgi:hypothetical protein